MCNFIQLSASFSNFPFMQSVLLSVLFYVTVHPSSSNNVLTSSIATQKLDKFMGSYILIFHLVIFFCFIFLRNMHLRTSIFLLLNRAAEHFSWWSCKSFPVVCGCGTYALLQFANSCLIVTSFNGNETLIHSCESTLSQLN